MDLLVLRRREPGAARPAGVTGWDRWSTSTSTTSRPASRPTIEMNRYFAEHPDRVLGVTVVGRGMYRDGELLVARRPRRRWASGSPPRLAADRSTPAPLRYTPASAPGAAERRAPAGAPARRRRAGGRSGWCRCARTASSWPRAAPSTGTRTATDPRRRSPSARPTRSAPSIGLRDATRQPARPRSQRRPRRADIEAARVAAAGPATSATGTGGARSTGSAGPAPAARPRHRRGEAPPRSPARLGGFRADPDWPTLSAIEVYDDDLDVASAATDPARAHDPPTAPAARRRHRRRSPGHLPRRDRPRRPRPDRRPARRRRRRRPRASSPTTCSPTPPTGRWCPPRSTCRATCAPSSPPPATAAERDSAFARNVTALEAVHPAQLGPERDRRPGPAPPGSNPATSRPSWPRSSASTTPTVRLHSRALGALDRRRPAAASAGGGHDSASGAPRAVPPTGSSRRA